MGATAVDFVEITGLSTSGTTDDTGTWNTGVDLDSFTTVPSGATAVILCIYDESSSPRWGGARTTGKTAAIYLADLTARSPFNLVVPLGAGNTVDLYAEAVGAGGVRFFITGFLGSEWTWFDIDGTAVTIAGTGGTWATRTVTEVGTGATSIICLPGGITRSWRPTGESTAMTNRIYGMSLMKLDASKQVDIHTSSSGNTTQVLGYATGGVTWNAWLGTTLTYTADSTWRTGPTASGKAFSYLEADEGVTTYFQAFRATGSSHAFASIASGTFEAHFAPLDATNGGFDYNIETGETATIYVHATLDGSGGGGGATASTKMAFYRMLRAA